MEKVEQAVGGILRELFPLSQEYVFSGQSGADKTRKEQVLTICYQKVYRQS